MSLDTMYADPRDPSIDDVAYLTRSEHRVSTLFALTDRPQSRAELRELTGVSSSTLRRTIREFEDRRWVRRNGRHYEATKLGEIVAAGMADLLDRIETERQLRDVWHWLPDGVIELAIEARSALTVTVAEPDAPYRPVNRFESLLRRTDALRFIRPEVALMEPCLDVLRQRLDEEVTVTLIDRPNCHAYFFSTYPVRSAEMITRENFTVLEHDELPPYGVGLLDDRVVVSCYERDSGAVQAVIDADVPAIREWAESIYAAYEADARPVEPPQVLE